MADDEPLLFRSNQDGVDQDGVDRPPARAIDAAGDAKVRQIAPPEARAVDQNALTVFVKIKPNDIDALRDRLGEIGGENLLTNPYIRFAELTTTHFCRFVIVPADPSVDAPASLVFSSNFDGNLDAHLDELLASSRKGFDYIYETCEGYPGRSASAAEIKRFLRDSALPYAAFYKGHPGLSQRWIQNDIAVRREIEAHLDKMQATPGWPPSPAEIRDGIKARLAQLPGLSTAFFDRDLPTWKDALPFVIPASIAGILSLPLLIDAAAVYAMVLRYREIRDEPDPRMTNFPISNLTSMEDRTTQNQLTHLVAIKPGRFRLWTLKGVLSLINAVAHYVANQGTLGGIPSIHFARWVIIDGGKRLLFFSNYDGSWQNYLGDFIDKANGGLTSIWSNTVGFPKTRWLVNDGAAHEEQFKQWTRAHQLPTQVWYSAYPNETVLNVLHNAAVRERAGGSLSDSETLDWVRKI